MLAGHIFEPYAHAIVAVDVSEPQSFQA